MFEICVQSSQELLSLHNQSVHLLANDLLSNAISRAAMALMPSGTITSQLNQIQFAGEFDEFNLRGMLTTIYRLKGQGYDKVDLSFARLTHAKAPQMLPFAIYCRNLLHQGFEVRIELPDDSKLKRLFQNTNWAYLIDPRSYEPSDFHAATNMPACLFTDPSAQFQTVDKAVNLLLATLKITDRKQVEAIEWSVNEIADNVLSHSSSAVGGVMQVTSRLDKNMVEFVIADAGVGIPKTLREAHSYYTSDVHALQEAIKEGVTRNSATNMGNGLFGTFRLAELSGGRFGIYSGRASLKSMGAGRGTHIKDEKIPFSGSVVECSINLGNPELLSEALTFRGKKHSPFSNLDRIDESEKITIKLVDEAMSFGSRIAARPVKSKIVNLLTNTGAKIEIDLEGVTLITSSFADEVFGKVFVELGPLTFMNRVVLLSGSKIVRQLIDRAISQRVAVGLGQDQA